MSLLANLETDKSNALVIPFNRMNVLAGIFFRAVLVCLGTWMLIFLDEHTIFALVAASIMVLFCAVTAYIDAKILFARNPALVLDSRGVVDNASALNLGLVPWHQISRVSTTRFFLTRFLTIKVRNPQKYLGRGGALRRFWIWMSARSSIMTLQIGVRDLAIDIDELVSAFEQYLGEYGYSEN